MDTPYGCIPVAKSTFAPNELLVMLPEVLLFLNTDIVLPSLFVTTKSLFPSPSISPMEIPHVLNPVANSTFA